MSTSLADQFTRARSQIDNDFFNQGLAAQQAPPPPLPQVGPQQRSNGETYYPRQIANHEDLALLRMARDLRQHVLLGGPPGCGKTFAVEAAFDSLFDPATSPGLQTVNGTAETTVGNLIGTYLPDRAPGAAPGTFSFLYGPLTIAVAYGLPLLVDEITLIDPGILSALYAVMDGRPHLLLPGTDVAPVPVQPGFCVFATYNPDAPGSVLSEALASRFAHHWQVGTDWDLALELGVPPEIVQVARNLDGQRLDRNNGLLASPQLRDLLIFRDQAAQFGVEYAAGTLAAKAAPENQDQILEAIQMIYPTAGITRLGGRYGR
ncbi:AAA family ATPase [Nonomuraea sp. NPDC046802]|uniref:AAA family ATPase n=1 Tax=Nonomuraea sp. NPDC046802 TaxID=3154919 RepID=UPI0033D03B7A